MGCPSMRRPRLAAALIEPQQSPDTAPATTVATKHLPASNRCTRRLCPRCGPRRRRCRRRKHRRDSSRSAKRLSGTTVIRAPGNLYWAGGMALAERIALQGDPDYLLWLNDDVTLDKDALTVLFGGDEANKAGHGIVVGALRDRTTDLLTYSG